MAFEYDGKIYRNLEEQVDYNKDCINDLDLRVTTLEGKETPVYMPSDLDLNTGIVAVTYDTTDGISLTTQGTIKANTGTNDVVVDYEIPVVAGAGILIDKKADADKIEVKIDQNKNFTIYGDITRNGGYFTVDDSSLNAMAEGSLYTSYGDEGGIPTIYHKQPNGTTRYKFPVNGQSQNVLTSKNVKTLFGNKSIVGSGNIDLYNHDITIKGSVSSDVTYEVHVFKTSSNNLKVDSLTDLKTLLGNTFKYWNVNGSYKNGVDYQSFMALYVTESIIAFQPWSLTSPEEVSLAGATFTDDVTTV